MTECVRSDADLIDSVSGDALDGVVSHATAGFELHLWGSFVADSNGFTKLVGRHIIEQDDVRLAVDDVAKRECLTSTRSRDALRRRPRLGRRFGQ